MTRGVLIAVAQNLATGRASSNPNTGTVPQFYLVLRVRNAWFEGKEASFFLRRVETRMNGKPHCVFIAGGTGYMGRRLIPRLLERGHKVRALVRRGSEFKLIKSEFLNVKETECAPIFDKDAPKVANGLCYHGRIRE